MRVTGLIVLAACLPVFCAGPGFIPLFNGKTPQKTVHLKETQE